MSTISEKLALLLHTKGALKEALAEKGQSVTDESVFADYPDKVRAIETGSVLPALADPGAAADLAAGKQLIGRDGNVVTGSVATYGDDEGVYVAGNEISSSGDSVILKRIFTENVLFRPGSDVRLYTPLSGFGDASAADVAAGKTFTSEAGAKATGTGQIMQTGTLVIQRPTLSEDFSIQMQMAAGYGYMFTGNNASANGRDTFTIAVPSILVVNLFGSVQDVSLITNEEEVDFFGYTPRAFYVRGDSVLTIS